MSRLAAVHVPSLRLQLLEIDRPVLVGSPWVLGAFREGVSARVLEVSPAAANLGIESGMHLSELRRKFPRVQVVTPDPSLLSRFRRILSTLCAARCTAWEVTDDGDGLLDLVGISHLMGGDPEVWAERLRSDLEQASGVQGVRVALASSRGAAEILVRTALARPFIQASEQELPELLGSLALERVPWLGRSVRDQLERFQLRHLSDIRRFPHAFFRQHFGDTGERLSALARGLDTESSILVSPALAEEHVFQRDHSDHAELRSCVHELADRLSFALRERHLAAREVRLRLVWADGQELSSTHRADPACGSFLQVRDVAWMLLSELSVRRAPLRALRLSALRTETVAVQEDLFGAVSVGAGNRAQVAVAMG